MIEKIVVDPTKPTPVPEVLAQKLNEVIEAFNNQVRLSASRPSPRQPGPAQHIEIISMMAQRLLTGPYKLLSESEPSNDLVGAVGEVLNTLQETVKAYRESIVSATGPEATLEVPK